MPAIPEDFAYVESSPGIDVTLWLVDLSRASPPVAVARWTGGNGTFSASRDGKTLIIASPGDRSKYALHLVRPLTGEATVLFDGPPDGRVFFPRISPDGRSFAFTQQRESGSDGIWIGDIATGVARQLVPVAATAPAPTPYDWSEDGQWLAYFNADIGSGQGCCLFIENVVDGRRVRLGVGNVISWRTPEPRIVASAQTGKGDQGAFGAAVYTFAVALEQRTDLFAVDPRITQLTWNPTKDEFLYLQDTTGCSYKSSLWVRARTGDARRIGTLATVQRAWWSSDGSALYALVHGDGADGLIVDTASSRSIATIPGDAPTRACP
ncbi:MAG: Dipeptidyl peptidase N-terminal region [Solirubrobacteraceae bacterium]|nr:Dipeptidyl peptidase N-terminal region [Solirubrobacteraceae bacterium]